jgi:glycosyltransferase involved in cell wall biosynthesis
MVKRILHISNSPYASLAEAGPSYAIFRELAEGAEQYHVLAQNVRRAFSHDRCGNLHLHLVPARSAKVFALLAYRARRLVPRHRLDGIVCQDPLLGGTAGASAAGRHGIPVLVELHGDVYFRYLRSRNPAQRLLGQVALRVLRRADRVRATGPSLARALEEAGVDPARIVHVPYRVRTEFFDPARVDRSAARERFGFGDAFVVVSVGRFVKQKGYGDLVHAFAGVVREHPDSLLVLAGGGPLGAAYRRTIAELELDDSVRLQGWISREEQRELLGAADVYTQPSVAGEGEWMPRAVLEAMAMELPVVASRVGGMGDVVRDTANGLLVTPSQRTELRDALLGLAADAQRRRALGARARGDAEEFYDWDAGFDRYRAALYSMDSSTAEGT